MALTHEQYLAEMHTALADPYEWLEWTDKGESFQFSDGTTATNVQVTSLGSGRWEEHFEVVTLLPDETYVAWDYSRGLTEMQDSMSPVEMGSLSFEERKKVEETVVITKYVKP